MLEHVGAHTCAHAVSVCKCSHSCHNMQVELGDQLWELDFFLLCRFHRLNMRAIRLAQKFPQPLSHLMGTAFAFNTLLQNYLVHKTFPKLTGETLYHARTSGERKPRAKSGQYYHLDLLEGYFWFCSVSEPTINLILLSGHSSFCLSPRALIFSGSGVWFLIPPPIL